MIGSNPNDNNTLNAERVVPLAYLSNFWRFTDLQLINCEIEPDFSWSKECIISDVYETPEVLANPNVNPPNPLIQATSTSDGTFQINNGKYVPVVTFSVTDRIKF